MPDSDRVSLIIGIDVYSDRELAELPSCKKDAFDMSTLLSTKGFAGFQNSPIIGSDIAHEKFSGAILRDTITRFFSEAKPSQLLLFYFSGHGVHGGSELYLAAPDVDFKNPRSRGFSLEDLTKCIGESHSRQIIAIIDACYSGGLNLPNVNQRKKAGEDSVQQAQAKYEETINKLYKRKERHFKQTALLLASQSFEHANAPKDGNRNSIYTQYLIEGIQGIKSITDITGKKILGSIDEDGNVTPQSLHKYVSYRVESLDYTQAPKFKCDESNEPIILATYSELVKPPTTSDESAEPSTFTFTDNPYYVNIKKRAKKIKDVNNKFLKLYKSKKDTNSIKDKNPFEDEIEKTSNNLEALYAEAERIKDEGAFLTGNYDKGRIEQDSYVKKMSYLTERMAHLEFELEKNVCTKLESIKKHLIDPEPQSTSSKSNQHTSGKETLKIEDISSLAVPSQEKQVASKIENVTSEDIHIKVLKTMFEATKRMDGNEFARIVGLSDKDLLDEMENLRKAELIRKVGKGFGITEKGKAKLLIGEASLKNAVKNTTETQAASVANIPAHYEQNTVKVEKVPAKLEAPKRQKNSEFSAALTLHGHTDWVRSCAWSPDGQQILSASNDKTLKIWDAKTGSTIQTLKGHTYHHIYCCAWSPDGQQILSASGDKTLKIWDAKTGSTLQTLHGHTDYVRSCAWSPDGQQILSASDDKTLKIWDAKTGSTLQTLHGHTDWVYCCTWSPNGQHILSGSRDKTFKIWYSKTGSTIQTIKGHTFYGVLACAWSPDGQQILSASDDKTLKIWDAKTDSTLQMQFVDYLTLTGHEKSVESCAWSPDGQQILSGSKDNTLKVWDAKTGQLIQTLCGHDRQVFSCAWSPDGQQILSGSKDNTLKVWDLR